MSDEIREQEWKAMWENQEFKPPGDGWEKMARALSGTDVAPAPKLLPWWGWRRYGKIAAAAAVLSLGTWSVWQFSNQPATTRNASETMIAQAPEQESHTPATIATPSQSEPTTDAIAPVRNEAQHTLAASTAVQGNVLQELDYTFREKPEVDILQDMPVIVKVQAEEIKDPISIAPAKPLQPEVPSKELAGNKSNRSGFEPITNHTSYFDEPQLDKSMSIGLAANIGKPNLGNVQYNVGVVLRKEWTDAFYTEASVSMAATDVRFSEHARYGISYKNGEMVSSDGSNAAAANTIGETQNIYGNNILGVGIAPMVGYKVTKQVSLSVGVDLYRNINTGLNLYYNSDIAHKDIKAMSMVKNVSPWDSGVKGQLGIRISKALSVLGQYRQGLTNYISTDQKTYKSSLFNIGLMYRFQP
ncbi:hypothetical protein D3C86_1006820 [compost metagenome]